MSIASQKAYDDINKYLAYMGQSNKTPSCIWIRPQSLVSIETELRKVAKKKRR